MESSEQFVKNLLLEDPSLSIEKLQKEVGNRYPDLTGENIKEIRNKVKNLVQKGHGWVSVTDIGPFNPPRIAPKKAPMETAKKDRESTPEERRRWFETWALDHPDVTVDTARKAISEQFGIAIGTKAIVDILDYVRGLHRESRAMDKTIAASSNRDKTPMEPVGSGNPIKDLVEMARKLGVKRLEIKGINFSIEMEGEIHKG